MTSHRLIAVCGAAAALLATPLFAQSGTSNPRQPAETRPTLQPGAARPDSAGTIEPAVLSRLEGVWRVEVSLHEGWKDHMHGKPGDTTKPGMDKPAQQPDRNTTTGTGSPDQKSFTGYSERKLIMGDNILQESIVVPDMPTGTMKNTGGADDRADRRENAGDHVFRGISFISFDEPSQKYRIVFMDSRHNDIHVDAGRFDAKTRSIVFHGKAGHQDSSDATAPGTQPGNKSDPADFARKPAGENPNAHDGRSHSGYGDVRVVVEVLSDDQHRVTMYRNQATASNAPKPGDAQNRPADRQPATTPGTDQRLAATDSESIVYRAVYTRATGAEANRYLRLIDEDRSLTRANQTDR